MSHSSGIPVSQSLKDAFVQTKRIIKVQIENDELVETKSLPLGANSIEKDFELISSLLETDRPCYILFNNNVEGKVEWLLLSYVPDKSKVKDKMIYASTRSNLKLGLGNSFFVDEVHGTIPSDFTYQGYQRHVTHKKSDAPLTESELMKTREVEQPVYMGNSSTYVHGVAFPVEANAIKAIQDLVSGSINYVQLSVDTVKERICLGGTDTIELSQLSDKIPTNEPRFHFFNYQHEFDGNNVNSFLYVFSCPDGSKGTTSAPVKLRMLYSSSKANVSDIFTKTGNTIALRLEVNAGSDIVEDEIYKQLHPQVAEKSTGFSKPSRPGKGARKLIRENK